MIGIYKITSPSNRIYIGQSINLEKRKINYDFNNCKKQTRLYNSFMKYGSINHIFEVLEECLVEELNIKERYYQDLYNVLSKKGLNCRLTATDDKSGKMSKESVLKSLNSRKGRKASSETLEKMSIIRKGKCKKGKKVINIENNVLYTSIRKAADDINIDRQHLTNMLNGRQRNKSPIRYIEAAQ